MSTLSLISEAIINRHDLFLYMNRIWQCYFADTPRINEVRIAYSYPWKSRLGVIRLVEDQHLSCIGINTLLQHVDVPEAVLITTIAHELVHYAHGFGSPLPRFYKHPHANGVVDRELERRNLGSCLLTCHEWLDKYWYAFYDRQRANGWSGITMTGGSTSRSFR